MTLLLLGIALWATVHFVPSLAQPLRQSLIGRLGENGYKGLFSLLIITSVALVVLGWRSIDQPTYLYTLPVWTRHLGMLLVLVAFVLMGAANYNTRIKQLVRHPQLIGVALWAVAHLVMNGDSRSLVLFGGLGVWAVVEIVLINRREGPWQKTVAPGWGMEITGALISFAVFVAVILAHPWIAGVAIR